jgi:phosphoribosylpyrophosphate synthetase
LPGAKILVSLTVSGAIKDEVAIDLKDMKVIGDVKGKVAILIEDLVDSCTTEVMMADALLQTGATQVFLNVVCLVH